MSHKPARSARLFHPSRHSLLARLVLLAMLGVGVSGWAGGSSTALGLEYLTFTREGKQIEVEGRLLAKAQDGGVMVQARDGVLWAVQADEVVKHTRDTVEFRPFSVDEMTEQLLAELPPGFEVHRTARYTIFHNTSRAYAHWCGSLFERLHRAFTNFWTRRGLELSEPEFPLTAIVFADRNSYVAFSRPEVGDAVGSIIGYFSLTTNRMVMYDLTGIEAFHRGSGGRATSSRIRTFLRRPEVLPTVATLVHEATHQITVNCGLYTRLSDCPTWFSEGLALYFETPDLSSSRGWRTMGELNRPRLVRFHEYLFRRPADSLSTLLADDRRLHDTKRGIDAYAEAWALTYFLINRYPDKYIEYVRMLSKKPIVLTDTPQTRLDEFQEIFGELESLDTQFVRVMSRTR